MITMTTVRAKVVRIGNSQGIRLPKIVLEQSGLGREVEIEVGRKRLVIQPIANPREGWDEAFRAMAKQGHDRLLDEDLTGRTSWDEDEWEW